MNEQTSDERREIEHGVAFHRLNRNSAEEFRAPKGSLDCIRCGAQYYLKHWHSFNQSQLQQQPLDLKKTLCPGCFRVANNIWHGTVVVQGEFIAARPKEAMSLVERVAHECWLDNPTSRIYAVTVQNDRIQMKTTTEWLATRIGKAFKKAHRGSLSVKGSPDKRTVDVVWTSP